MELRVQIELQVLFPVWKAPAKLFKYFLSVSRLPTWCNPCLENRGKDVQGDHKHIDKGKRQCVKYGTQKCFHQLLYPADLRQTDVIFSFYCLI